MNKLLICFLTIIMLLSLSSCSNKNESIIEYDYSNIKTHHYESTMSSIPITFDTLCSSENCLVEFTVSGDSRIVEQEVSYEDLNITPHTVQYTVIPINIDKIVFQNENIDVSQFKEVWLPIMFSGYRDSYVKGGRFLAFASVVNHSETGFEDIPMDFYIGGKVFYIDENEKLVPFFDLTPYKWFDGVNKDEFIDTVIDIRNGKENALAESIKEKEKETYPENYENIITYIGDDK